MRHRKQEERLLRSKEKDHWIHKSPWQPPSYRLLLRIGGDISQKAWYEAAELSLWHLSPHFSIANWGREGTVSHPLILWGRQCLWLEWSETFSLLYSLWKGERRAKRKGVFSILTVIPLPLPSQVNAGRFQLIIYRSGRSLWKSAG